MGIAIMSTMAGSAAGQEKKDEDRKGTSVKITVRSWDAQGKKFLNPKEGVEARRVESQGRVSFFVPVKQAIGTGQPRKGSEITDEDGTVYTVSQGSDNGRGEYMASVVKKGIEKKP